VLDQFDDGEQLAVFDDLCPCCGKRVGGVYHWSEEHQAIYTVSYCAECDESWGEGLGEESSAKYVQKFEDSGEWRMPFVIQ